MKTRTSIFEGTTPIRGFTLIELMGILAILAVILSATTEAMMARMKEALRQSEAAELKQLVEGFRKVAVCRHFIPGSGDWSAALARELGRPVQAIQNNAAGWTRVWITDPDLELGSGNRTLPFHQGVGGSVSPRNVRGVLVSCPTADVSPSPASIPRPVGMPSGETSRWNPQNWIGGLDDLQIERVTFEVLFHRVCLNNHLADSDARWMVDLETEVGSCQPGAAWEGWYLEGTSLHLVGVDGNIQRTDVVSGDVSWVFDSGRWSRVLAGGFGSVISADAERFDRFIRSIGPGPVQTRDVSLSLFQVLGEYVRWAEGGFPGPTTPTFRRLEQATLLLEEISSRWTSP